MKTLVNRVLLCAALLGGPACAAEPSLPKRDLTVELRQVVEGREDGATHYGAGGDDKNVWEPQMVQVRNGEKALLRLNDAAPMQWTQSVSTQNTAGNGSAAFANTNNPASVTNALVWFDAGQSVSVQAKWPGGNKPALLVLEVQRADVVPGAELPRQTRNTVSTTVTVPLAQWLTVAATGKAAKPGVYSSEAGVQGRRLLQVRVMVP
jgi:hypothetical protein